MIDENPLRVLQSKTSIFSLPSMLKRGGEVGSPCVGTSKAPKKKPFGVQHPHGSTTASLRKVTKPRQHSMPPYFPSSSPKKKSTSRKASAPARVSTCNSRTASASPESPNPARDVPSTPNDSDTHPCSGPSTPLQPLSSLGWTLDQTTYSPQDLPYALAGPSTPSTFLPDLLPEPFVASSTPVQLSHGSTLVSIANPSGKVQDSYNLDTSLVSSPDYSVFMPEFSPGSFLSSVFNATIGSGCLSHGVPTPTVSDPFESNLFTTYPMF